MSTYDIILKRRTIRKFKQDKISTETLKKLVNAARLAPQGANLQPMKYVIVTEKSTLDELFKTTAWAGYIRPQHDPKEDERPVAYIIALVDTDIKKADYDVDAGAAIENLILAALEEGIGTCWLGALKRDMIKQTLNIPDKYVIHSMIALGYLGEEPVTEDENGSIKYFKDENGVIHVPKRKLEDVILEIRE